MAFLVEVQEGQMLTIHQGHQERNRAGIAFPGCAVAEGEKVRKLRPEEEGQNILGEGYVLDMNAGIGLGAERAGVRLFKTKVHPPGDAL